MPGEAAHESGRQYQRAVKSWLIGRPILGLRASPFGDTYDATRRAATIGGASFDIALGLAPASNAPRRRILYVECKYRDERQGALRNEFREFIRKVCDGLRSAARGDAQNADFCLVATVPPKDWSQFLSGRTDYCRQVLSIGIQN